MPLASKVLWVIASFGTSLLVGLYLLKVGGILQIIDGISSGNVFDIIIGYFRFNVSFLVEQTAAFWVYQSCPELVQWCEKRFLSESSSKGS